MKHEIIFPIYSLSKYEEKKGGHLAALRATMDFV